MTVAADRPKMKIKDETWRDDGGDGGGVRRCR